MDRGDIPSIEQACDVFSPVPENRGLEMFREGLKVVLISALRRTLEDIEERLRTWSDEEIKSFYTLDGVLDQDGYTAAREAATILNGEHPNALDPVSWLEYEYGSTPHYDLTDGTPYYHPGVYDPPSQVRNRAGWVSAIMSMQLSWRTHDRDPEKTFQFWTIHEGASAQFTIYNYVEGGVVERTICPDSGCLYYS